MRLQQSCHTSINLESFFYYFNDFTYNTHFATMFCNNWNINQLICVIKLHPINPAKPIINISNSNFMQNYQNIDAYLENRAQIPIWIHAKPCAIAHSWNLHR